MNHIDDVGPLTTLNSFLEMSETFRVGSLCGPSGYDLKYRHKRLTTRPGEVALDVLDT